MPVTNCQYVSDGTRPEYRATDVHVLVWRRDQPTSDRSPFSPVGGVACHGSSTAREDGLPQYLE